MDRRTIVALVLIVIIASLYPKYQRWVSGNKPPVSKVEQTTTPGNNTPPQTGQSAAAVTEKPATEQAPWTSSPRVAAASGDKASPKEAEVHKDAIPLQTITVETGVYLMELSNRGMSITSYKLKNYKNGEAGYVQLVPPESQGAPYVKINDPRQELSFINVPYNVNTTNIVTRHDRPEHTLECQSVNHQGFTVTTTYTFYHEKYYFDKTVRITWKGVNEIKKYSVVWQPGILATEPDVGKDYQSYSSGYKRSGEKFEKKKFKQSNFSEDGRVEWVGTKSKYFALFLIPTGFLGSDTKLGLEIKETEQDEGKIKPRAVSLALSAPLQKDTDHTYRIYFGPKDYDILKDTGVGLEEMMNLGWPIIKPIALVLRRFFLWMHQYISNWGLVIIVFSIVLKMAFYPLTHKSFTAAQDMQKVQPLMNEIRQKYKGDNQRINQETMKLYKEHGVNPLGGCLPMFLQMPVFFALFKVFDTNIEFRQAAFAGWIQDLSRPDPTYILPIFMGVTMFLQQKLSTGASQDEKQKMMMYMMPVMFTFIFLRLSSGLILYYTVFNILSIGQQLLIKRKEALASSVPTVAK